jgi:hypothetical protein
MMNPIFILSSVALAVAQPSMAQSGPGRCTAETGQFAVNAADLSDELLPYARCLTEAEQRYGFNGGPFAVSQCAEMRSSIAAALPAADARRGESLLDEMDRGFVWQVWCSTDVGSELPVNVPIKAGWPQAQRKTNAPDQ